MVKIGKKEKNGELYKAILLLKDEQECYEFFQDLCTVSELRAMEQGAEDFYTDDTAILGLKSELQ